MLDRRDSDRSAIDAACAVNLVDGGLTALWPVIVYWSLQRAVCPIAIVGEKAQSPCRITVQP